MLKRLTSLAVLILISACGTKIPPPLTAEQRAEYGVARVVVDVPKTANFWWGAGERAVMAASGRTDATGEDQTRYLESPEGIAALTARAEAMLQPVVERNLKTALTGPKPMQVSVVVDGIFVSSTAQQLIVGGNHGIDGGIQLFDLETGQALSRPQRLAALEDGGAGVIGAIVEAASRDPVVRLGERFGELAAAWIRSAEPIPLGIAENPPPLPAMPEPVAPDAPSPTGTEAVPAG